MTQEVTKSIVIPVAGELASVRAGMILKIWPSGSQTHDSHILSRRVVEVKESAIVVDEPVTLKGASSAYVIWGLTTQLAAPAMKGERSLRVEHPEQFAIGQGFYFYGQGGMWGFQYNAVAGVDGDVISLSRRLRSMPPTGTEVRLQHSAIVAEDERNIAVENLVIRGLDTPYLPQTVGFMQAAIHVVNCKQVAVRNVQVHHWNGDGFSVQGGDGATIAQCIATYNHGHGFHPGTGLHNAEFVDLKSLHNTCDGLYYCWYNKNVNVRRSELSDNVRYGVGRLGNPGDHNNTVEDCLVERNGAAGIHLYGGGNANNTIRRNTVRDNSRLKPGAWPGILITATSKEAARKNTVEENIVESTLNPPTQWIGIEERAAAGPTKEAALMLADENRIIGNKCQGHKTSDIVLCGPHTVEQDNSGKVIRNARE